MARLPVTCVLAVAALLAACSSGSSSSTPAPAAVCGDGTVTAAAGEACDDANLVDGDGCDSNCTVTACGNGVVTAGEACDDGGASAACDADCTPATCGDATVNAAAGEACDDGGESATCDADCTAARCGDGTPNVTAGEQCDTAGASASCDADCTLAACGDGVVNPAAGEACDDANLVDGDGCDSNCAFTACGNGIRTSGEACDDGNLVDTDGCTSLCLEAVVCDVASFAAGDRFAVDPATGHCYVAFEDETTRFSGAATACSAGGGHLVTIGSAAEDAVVAGALGPSQTPWIGAVDDANDTDAVFAWVTGEPWAYARFAPGEPDDDAATTGLGDCLHVANAAGEWADTACDATGVAVGRICEYELAACGNGTLDAGEACDDGNLQDGDGCTACALDALWFSEYVEGTSNNKALEIVNPLASAVDLSGCSISVSFNGSPGAGGSYALSATVAANDVLVVCNASAGPALLALCDRTTSSQALQFNGDDAIVLSCGGVVMDVVGQVGFDPGLEWGTGDTTTADATLRRRCAVTAGDTNGSDGFDPAVEWAGYPVDTFSDLGLATCEP